jgi:hypothetical protein
VFGAKAFRSARAFSAAGHSNFPNAKGALTEDASVSSSFIFEDSTLVPFPVNAIRASSVRRGAPETKKPFKTYSNVQESCLVAGIKSMLDAGNKKARSPSGENGL